MNVLENLRWNRRIFLQNLALAATASVGFKARAAAAPRRHLINIVARGGWDGFWFHNALRQAEVAGHVATIGAFVQNNSFVAPPGSSGYSGVLAPASAISDGAPPDWPYHVRYPDSFTRAHPHQPSALLGPGFANFSDDDLATWCIWKGVRAEGGHDTGNRILQTGTTGDQTSSFPALVALELAAQRGLRPLHYTQLANTRALLCNQLGPISLGEPVMIPDQGTWSALTSPGAREFSAKVRQRFDDTLERLAKTTRLTQASNRAAYESIASAHQGSVGLMASGYGTSPAFTDALTAYTTELSALKTNHVFGSWFPLASADVNALAFRFALAEFLVVNDLSAVVDVPALGGDFHTENDSDAVVALANLTAMQVLVRRLKQQKLGDDSMLDHTTVVMHTEMERSPTLLPNFKQPNRAGTGHWDLMTSVFLAGAGIAQGRVVGEFARPVAGSWSSATFGLAPYAPLPIDLMTGVASKSGSVVGVRSLFSTLLSSFGASARSQLQVHAPVVAALLR